MARNVFRRRSLTASVSVVPQKRDGKVRPKSKDAEWQKEAWAFYHDLGEIRFAARYVGNGLARIRFFVGTRDHPGDPVVPIPDELPEDEKADQDAQALHDRDLIAREILDRVRGRDGTFASLVRLYGLQHFVAGENFLVAEDGLDGERWEFLSTSAMRVLDAKRQQYARINDETGDEVEIDENSHVLRFWQRDPEFRERADSPLRAVLDICDALRTAQAMQTAGDKSRLATAGIYFVPAEAEMPKAPVTERGETKKRLQLIDDLLAAATAAMEDPGSAAALVPILIEAKAEFIDNFKHETFDRKVDDKLVERIDHLIRRLAQGIDLPPEKLLGVANMNHWGAWQVNEETITAHLAPMAAQFAEDMTVGFVRPTLKETPDVDFDLDRYAIGFDTSDLLAKPNPADNALELYDRMLLAAVETVQALGYREDQMPDEEEIAARMEREAALAPPNPFEQAPAAQQQEDDEGVPVEDADAPVPPEDTPPEQQAAVNRAWQGSGRMIGACDVAVEQVLTRAGAKIAALARQDPDLARRIEGVPDIEVPAVLGRDAVAALIEPKLALADAWTGITPMLHARLAAWAQSEHVAFRIINGLDVLTEGRMFDPNVDVVGAASILCEVSLGLGEAA